MAAGEEVIITRHGRAVARLVKAELAGRGEVDDAIGKLKALRKGATWGGEGWKALGDLGRR